MALEFTEENFESMALKSDKLVMVDFWAEWCGPCRMVGPHVEELSKEYDGKAVVGKVNVDLHGGIAAQFGVRNIPTIVFLKNVSGVRTLSFDGNSPGDSLSVLAFLNACGFIFS